MYRPRNPRASPLFQLFETYYETVKAVWEERFERQYGFWQGRWDRAVAAYIGFAIVRCPVCKAEYHVAFSCRCRGLCPSCSAKRAAIFSELLEHRILADVAHAQWVFSIPKMLRPYFLCRRELLGDLARLAYETVREMMAAAIEEPDARPGERGHHDCVRLPDEGDKRDAHDRILDPTSLENGLWTRGRRSN